MEEYARFVDILGVSADSFVPTTNAAIGRGGDAKNKHARRVLKFEKCVIIMMSFSRSIL